MRKNVFGRQFKRDANERKALFKNLLTSLVMHERIETSHAKAKAIRGAADKLVTRAKQGGDHAYRHLGPQVRHEAVVKLVNDIAPRFVTRQGGYTRIIKTHRRVADNAPMALIEWTEKPAPIVAAPKTEKKPKKDAKEAEIVAEKPKKTEKKVAAKPAPAKKAAVKKTEKKEKAK